MKKHCYSTRQPYKTSRGSVWILNRWTEHYSDLFNYKIDGNPTVLDRLQIKTDEEHYPILRNEVEAAVKALKMGKSAGVGNIPADLV